MLNSSQAGAAMFLRLLLGAMAQQLLRVAPREGLLSHCPGSPGEAETVVTATTETWPRTRQALSLSCLREPPPKGCRPLGT